MIYVESLMKNYNGEPCLRGVDLHIKKGEFVSVKGESGSGKTTLLEILVGLRAPDGGSVRVAGEEIFSLNASALAKFRRTKIGVVYQNFGLIPTLSAMENICLPMLLEKRSKEETERRVLELAKRLKIEGALRKRPEELSGGQQQRVAVARAVCYNPEVLFLDEPTGSLDSENTRNVLEFFAELNREQGTTILQITHDERASSYGNRVIHIADGRILS